MMKRGLAAPLLLVALSALFSGGCGDDDAGSFGSTTAAAERAWFDETEFARDPGLRATPEHVVILRLGAGRQVGGLLHHRIPFRFDDTAPYTFCIPEDEPHIRALDLVPDVAPAATVHVTRGAACQTVTIAAGLYQLHVDHDGSDVPAEGTIAFVHVPRSKETLQATGVQGSFPGPCDPTLDNNPYFLLTAPNGLSINTSYLEQVYTLSGLQSAAFDGLVICSNSSGNYTFELPHPFNTSALFWLASQYPVATTAITGGSSIAAGGYFKLADLGNGQFTATANVNGSFKPVVVGPGLGSGGLEYSTNSATAPGVFTVVSKYYAPGRAVPPLVTGEVAFTGKCNYDSSPPSALYTGGTWVLHSNTTVLDPELIAISSVRVGPQTIATLYTDANYGGTAQVVGEDTPCLSGTPISSKAGSIKISAARAFVISTNACKNCNLSGVDLSGLNLVGGQYQGSTFTGANLTNTNLQSAALDNANLNGAGTGLSGTNFVGAILRCTNFSGANLSHASTQVSGVVPVITTDFSCRTDLSGATLNLNAFPLTQWRYLNLTGATINGVAGATLSTTSSPLDLSRALLGRVTLPGVVLQGANLAGATFARADLTGADLGSVTAPEASPAVFNGANMSRVFLKNASLPRSFFRGASLNPANLGGADLAGAWMEVDSTCIVGGTCIETEDCVCRAATLSSSYMLNTDLSGAHMTDAVLDSVSWYNTNPAVPLATGAGAFLNGASFNLADLPGLDLDDTYLQGATLTNTQLIGANLSGARLDRNGTARANLSTANLRGATLTGANLAYANLFNAGADPAAESEVYIEVLKDPDHYQKPAEYQYFAVNRPPTVLGAGNAAAVTDNATCPNGAGGSCGVITDPKWIAPQGPQEPTDCMPTQYDNQGNVIAITCSSSRHPT